MVWIDVLDRERSHWAVKAPAGGTVEWDSRITEDREVALRRFKQRMETGDIAISSRTRKQLEEARN